MGRRLIPLAVVLAILAFAVAAGSIALVPDRFSLWNASLALVVLGGITPLIYSVNARIVPVFSRREWQSTNMMYLAIIAAVASGWLLYFGRGTGRDTLALAGSWTALAGGLLFTASIIRLFRSPVTAATAPPLPFPEQAPVDRVATRFTRLAGIFLLIGLVIGVALHYWTPSRGRWDLVWAHTMLVGWFLTMASGVAYHVLARWTGKNWKSVRRIETHFYVAALSLPAMLVALALNMRWLFAIAGTLQMSALILFVVNIVPLARVLPRTSRYAVIAAGIFLSLGVSLGASVAMDPTNHVNLRFTHASINLFGWAGLLVCGVGYYLFPRFAGQPLAWPRLALIQVPIQVAGVVIGATGWWWYLAVNTGAKPVLQIGGALTALGLLLFALIMARTFAASAGQTVSTVDIQRRTPAHIRERYAKMRTETSGQSGSKNR